MASFPEYCPSETDKRIKNNEWGRHWIDAIVEYGNSGEQQERQRKIETNFNTHNGIYSSKAKQYIIKAYGKELSTEFVPFHLAETKEKLLFGEMLDIGLKSTVESINPEAINAKLKQIAFMTEAIQNKPILQSVEEDTGMKLFSGMNIPDPGTPDAEEAIKPKRRNEIVVQRITDKKIEEDYIKLKLYECIKSLVITSECHGVVDLDADGVDTFRYINPKHMIFQESDGDPFCLRTPFVGERRLLYKNEILNQCKGMDPEDVEKVKEIGTSESDTGVNYGDFEHIDGQVAIWCCYANWKTSVPVIIKVAKNKKGGEPYQRMIDPEHYEKYKPAFDRDVASKKYTIEKWYKDEIWEGLRIGNQIYYGIRPKERQIQRTVNGKYRAFFDYVHCLYGTVDGKRVSLEELIHNLSEVYDLILHIIKREIKKMKGKVFTYNERYMPDRLKNMSGVMYDVVEHGIIQMNSSIDGNDPDEIQRAGEFIKEVDLGLSDSFKILLELKADIERTVDKLTGINENREGFGKASSTATTAIQNMESSRSITRDLFYLLQLFSSLMLTKMTDKVKINERYLKNIGQLFLNEEDLSFIGITEGIGMDEFAAYFTDGKKYNEIKEFAMQLFPQEINAGQLRTKDAIRFKASESLSEGLQVLDKAWEEIDQIRQQEQKQQAQQQQAERDNAIQLAQEDREDNQAHEMEKEELEIRGKKELEQIKIGGKGMIESTKARANEKQKEMNPDASPPQL